MYGSEVEWVEEFYSVTDSWWGDAESVIDDTDRARSRFVGVVAPNSSDVLELRCGYGATAVAIGQTGRSVIAVDISDRIERAHQFAEQAESVRFVRGDFYTFDAGRRFDVVCYWDGFGIGCDRDQLSLLKRVADEWLRPDGVAVVEVFHPAGWITDDGLDEIREPSPDGRYAKRLGHRRHFDHESSTAVDSWWEIGSTTVVSQSLRCYRPDEFACLARDAGLSVVALVDPAAWTELAEVSARDSWSYVAVLQRVVDSRATPHAPRQRHRGHRGTRTEHRPLRVVR